MLLIAGVAGTLGLAAYFTVSAFTNTATVARFVDRALGPGLRSRVKSIVFRPPSTLVFSEIAIEHEAFPGKPLFEADSVTMRQNVEELLEGRVKLERVQISGWKLHLERAAGGSWNLPRNPLEVSALPEVRRGSGRLLAMAGLLKASTLEIALLDFEAGKIELEDGASRSLVPISDVEAHLALRQGKLSAHSIGGRVLGSAAIRISGEASIVPPLSGSLRLELDALELSKLQDRIPPLALQAGGGAWKGSARLVGELKRGASGVEATADLIVRDVHLPAPWAGLRSLAVAGGEARLTLSRAGSGEPARPAAAPGERGTGAEPPSSTDAGRPQGEPTGAIELDLSQTTLRTAGLAVPVGALRGAIDFAGSAVTIRKLEGSGGGTIAVSGQLRGPRPSLDIRASRFTLNQLVDDPALLQAVPWLDGAILLDVKARAQAGALSVESLELLLGASRGAGSCNLRFGPSGRLELADAKGKADVEGSLLGRMMGFEDPARVAGRAEVEFIWSPEQFTGGLRSRELVLAGEPPELQTRSLAAAFKGGRARSGKVPGAVWGANVRSGPFKLTWPLLLETIGSPVRGPVDFDTGAASVTCDGAGVRISSLECRSKELALTGDLGVARDGGITGRIGVARQGASAASVTAQIGGTLARPELVSR